MDLDDDELKATRRMNGSDKNVGSIEEDMERCEQLTKLEHANWIGLSNQSAIKHLVEEYKELKEENAMLKEVDKITKNITPEEIENAIKEADKNFIPVSLVEEKIEEYEEKAKRIAGTYQYADSGDDLENKKKQVIELRTKAEGLQDFLEGK